MLSILGTNVAMMPVEFAVGVLVARILGPQDRGIYAFLLLLAGMLLPISFIGLRAGITYFISSGRFEARDVAVTCVLSGLAHGVLCALLVGALWHFDALGETARYISARLIVPVLLSIPLLGVQQALQSFLFGSSWFAATNVIHVVKSIIRPALLVAFVIVGSMGLYGAMLSMVGTTIVLAALSLGLVWRRHRPPVRLDTAFLKEGYRYGFPAWFGGLSRQGETRLDHFILGVVGDPAGLGNYTIAVRMMSLLTLPVGALIPVFFNRISGEKDMAKRAELTNRIHRVAFFLIGLMAVAFASVVWWLIPLLFGEAYADAVAPALILIPGTLAFYVTRRILARFTSAVGEPKYESATHVVGGIVGAVAYLLLIPPLGIVGAAAGSTLSYVTAALVAYGFYRRVTRPVRPALFRLSRGDVRWLAGSLRSALGVWRRRFLRPSSEEAA